LTHKVQNRLEILREDYLQLLKSTRVSKSSYNIELDLNREIEEVKFKIQTIIQNKDKKNAQDQNKDMAKDELTLERRRISDFSDLRKIDDKN